MEQLTHHQQIYHILKPFSCTICGFKFRRKYHLERHEKIHKKPATLYPCLVCDAKFVSQYALTRHQSEHDRKSLYSCVVCDSKFTTLSAFKHHQETHHLDDDSDFFKCDVCELWFGNKKDLATHTLTHGDNT